MVISDKERERERVRERLPTSRIYVAMLGSQLPGNHSQGFIMFSGKQRIVVRTWTWTGIDLPTLRLQPKPGASTSYTEKNAVGRETIRKQCCLWTHIVSKRYCIILYHTISYYIRIAIIQLDFYFLMKPSWRVASDRQQKHCSGGSWSPSHWLKIVTAIAVRFRNDQNHGFLKGFSN